MTEQTGGNSAVGGTTNSQSSAPSGDTHPAQSNNPVTRPANPPPEFYQPAENPRSRGYSPARDARATRAGAEQPAGTQDQQRDGQQQGEPGDQQQQPDTGPATIKIGDVEYTTDQVNEALKYKSEQDIRKTGLPASPDAYELAMPPDFKPPEGVRFDFDPDSAELQNFKRLAHARGFDQTTFSEALGIYAASRIGEQQQLGTARSAEMAKLGSAAHNRIDAVETWLKSQVGSKANLIVNQLKNFPVAGMVEMFEQLARNASNQGSANYSQGGRQQEENPGKIPGFENMTFAQKRAAQDQQLGAQTRREGRAR